WPRPPPKPSAARRADFAKRRGISLAPKTWQRKRGAETKRQWYGTYFPSLAVCADRDFIKTHLLLVENSQHANTKFVPFCCHLKESRTVGKITLKTGRRRAS